MFEQISKDIEAIITPAITEMGLELIELNVRRQGKTVVIQVFIDRPAGGVTIDECTKVNKTLTNGIEDTGLIHDDYTVEVSSPGLDRALKSRKDFVRAKGREVRFHLYDKIADKLEQLGFIKDVGEQIVTIETKSGDVSIPLEKISKAVQIIDK